MSPARAGFSLLEVVIAVVLTSVVALMAVGSAQVSAASARVIHGSLQVVGSDRATRQVLLDLLHNVRPPLARGDTSLALGGDTLRFTAAGASPLDAEYDWMVAIHAVDGSLTLDARTAGRAPAARSAMRLGRATGWRVLVLPPGAREWRTEWAPAAVLPAAVAITLLEGERPLGPPLVVRLSDAASGPSESEYLAE
jgi:prepilin-type N-terminal cleavage/methylation domain-containing protein